MHKVFLNVMEILDQRRPPLGAFSGSASKISHRLESADDLWSKGRFEVRRVRKGPWLTQRAASRWTVGNGSMIRARNQGLGLVSSLLEACGLASTREVHVRIGSALA